MEKFKIVEDGRTLKAMIKRGFIGRPEYGAFPQVDATFDQFFQGFTYKGVKYEIKYFDGSLYPFVVTLTDKYIHANWNNLKEQYRR